MNVKANILMIGSNHQDRPGCQMVLQGSKTERVGAVKLGLKRLKLNSNLGEKGPIWAFGMKKRVAYQIGN